MGPSAARPRSLAFLIVGLLAVGTSGCGSSSSLPDDYLGQWYYQGSSGGLSGDGAGDPATGYIVITQRNTLEHYSEEGTLTAIEPFDLERGRTIFSADPQWVLRSANSLERVIQFHEDGTLSISDNVYDGYHMGYARSR